MKQNFTFTKTTIFALSFSVLLIVSCNKHADSPMKVEIRKDVSKPVDDGANLSLTQDQVNKIIYDAMHTTIVGELHNIPSIKIVQSGKVLSGSISSRNISNGDSMPNALGGYMDSRTDFFFDQIFPMANEQVGIQWATDASGNITNQQFTLQNYGAWMGNNVQVMSGSYVRNMGNNILAFNITGLQGYAMNLFNISPTNNSYQLSFQGFIQVPNSGQITYGRCTVTPILPSSSPYQAH